MTAEFTPFPKMARFYRDIVITEKIDGTNAAITFTAHDFLGHESVHSIIRDDFVLTAQSRSRLISTKDDNFGFAKWCEANAEGLFATLGWGTHFGEWWGSGIQRGYGLPKGEKRFSLFNTSRWKNIQSDVPGLGVVPVLYTGTMNHCYDPIHDELDRLEDEGSFASPGFMKPEGLVIFHTAANSMFKVTLENDEVPKGLVK